MFGTKSATINILDVCIIKFSFYYYTLAKIAAII